MLMNTFIPQELYNQILRSVPIACVDLVIVSREGALLLKRKDAPARGQWWIPGGRVFRGERLKDAARRKALDEVGLSCYVGPLIHNAETIFPDGPFDIPVHCINSCFLLHPIEDMPARKVKIDDHHSDWKWVASIPPDVDRYVEDCLKAAGLERQQN